MHINKDNVLSDMGKSHRSERAVVCLVNTRNHKTSLPGFILLNSYYAALVTGILADERCDTLTTEGCHDTVSNTLKV
jgi:hypothetical protein